jgi:hypothetical protein
VGTIVVRLILHWVNSSQNMALRMVDFPVETPPTKQRLILSTGRWTDVCVTVFLLEAFIVYSGKDLIDFEIKYCNGRLRRNFN